MTPFGQIDMFSDAGTPERRHKAGQEPGPGPVFPDTGTPERGPRWLGLATDHRRLFGALENGWLRPLGSRAGVTVGIGAYAAERDHVPAGHPITVRMRLDAAKLPALEVSVCRGDRWVSSRLGEFDAADVVLYWPGVLPVFAIVGISVSSEEERRRLEGLAQSVSNVDLADVGVDVDPDAGGTVESGDPPAGFSRTLVVPKEEDALHGATSMAVWAVPRIDPWLNLLTASLAFDGTRLSSAAAAVDAGWWRFPPWTRPLEEPRPSSVDECLWWAAVNVFRERPAEGRPRPRELAERIAEQASRLGGSACSDGVAAWLEATHRILRADSTINFDAWRACPVGLALQLVLTRPVPESFRTWFQERPDLAPAVAWSAAALCGLLRGYRRLGKRFRGDSLQREMLSIHALRACGGDGANVTWPSLADEAPRWQRDGGEFVLSWDGREFSRKPEKARGRWYAANFEDAAVQREAWEIARKKAWPCLHREIALTDGQFPLSGSGCAETVGNSLERRLEVQGTVRMRLPATVAIEDGFDVEAFRRAVAVEAGTLPDPPLATVRPGDVREPQTAAGGTLPDPPLATVRAVRFKPTDVPGLKYVLDFISEREEEELVAVIDGADWSSELQRRVQHYGWRYDYKARKIDASMRIGPLPEWAARLARRLVSKGLLTDLPDQVIVNEYVRDQGITKRVDSENFADGIATISLLESWEMVFREKKTRGRPVKQRLDHRSAAIMTGDARYRWTHEIPKRKNEPSPAGQVKRSRRGVERGRRISLTFRKVLAPPDGVRDGENSRGAS